MPKLPRKLKNPHPVNNSKFRPDKQDYIKAYKELRKIHDFSFDLRNLQTKDPRRLNQMYSAITRQAKNNERYIKEKIHFTQNRLEKRTEELRFAPYPKDASRAQIAELKKAFPQTATNKGLLISVPKDSKAKPNINLKDFTFTDSAGRKRTRKKPVLKYNVGKSQRFRVAFTANDIKNNLENIGDAIREKIIETSERPLFDYDEEDFVYNDDGSIATTDAVTSIDLSNLEAQRRFGKNLDKETVQQIRKHILGKDGDIKENVNIAFTRGETAFTAVYNSLGELSEALEKYMTQEWFDLVTGMEIVYF